VGGTPSENRYRSFSYNNVTYVSIGNKLYKITAAAGLYTGFVDTGLTFTSSISDMVVFNNLLHIAQSGAKLLTYDGVTLTDVTATYSGAWYLAVYADMLFWTSGVSQTLNWRVTATPANYSRANYWIITGMCVASGSLYFGDVSGLYKLNGILKAGTPSTPGTLNLFEPEIVKVLSLPTLYQLEIADYNYGQMQYWAGYLWYWANGRVWRLKPSDNLGSGEGIPEVQPLFGRLRGMAVCDGLLVVALKSGSMKYLWAWESVHGWWLVESGSAAANDYTTPFSASIMAKDAGLCTVMNGTFNLARWPIDNTYLSGRNPNNFALADVSNTGYVVLPGFGLDDLATAGGFDNRGVVARLLACGVEWGFPGDVNDWFDATAYAAGGGSAGAVTFGAEISIDGGVTWVSLGSFAPINVQGYRSGKARFAIAAAQGEAINLTAAYPALYIIRVKAVGPNSPALHRVWVDYKLERVQVINGREWKLKLNLANPDDMLALTGQSGSSSGGWASAAAGLSAFRDLWLYGNTVDYFDIDGSGAYKVKLKDFKAVRGSNGKPYDWEFTVTLCEVIE
jgi:hypothetical protein